MAMDMQSMNPDGLPMGIFGHPLREVAQTLPVPGVTIEAFRDSMDGYNVLLTTKDFTFTPETIGRAPVANEGHAHIYVNGIKAGRLYGHWVQIGSKYLTEEVNTIEVTLNANDHSEWAIDGKHIGSITKVGK